MIYNKEPILALFEIVKPLMNDVPIYKEAMTEDENSTPDSYILLRSDVSDSGDIYGDGRTQTRSSDCDILLVSKGYADSTDDLHNINLAKIKQLLKDGDINYYGSNLGYDDTLKSTQYSFSLSVRYYG